MEQQFTLQQNVAIYSQYFTRNDDGKCKSFVTGHFDCLQASFDLQI
jgi:hypothetical protein